jgi:glycosyltransferase involved in cell wall biosynthesis
MNKVTVIMPAYRVADTIEAAVDSVLCQTWEDFELIVVNDGCPQRSGFLAQRFGDARVRVIDQANRGLAGARNTGIAFAEGEYIAFLDSDDLWHPDKLAAHVAHLDAQPQVGVSYCPSELIDEAGEPIGIVQRPKLRNITPRDVFCRNPIGNGSAPVLRRQVFDDIAYSDPRDLLRTRYFDEHFRQSEDIECWMRIALLSDWRFEGIASVLTRYRVSGAGLSADVVRQYDSWQKVVEKIRAIDPGFVRAHEGRARGYQLRYLARRATRMRDRGFAWRLMQQALATHPGILIEEPVKTLTTLAATVLLRGLDERHFSALERLALALNRPGQTS